METIEIPGVGTGYLVDGLVAVREAAGGIGSRPAESLTADSIVADGLFLATEEEAAMLAGDTVPDPADTHDDKGGEHLEQPPEEGGN